MSRLDILAPVEVVAFSNLRPRREPAQPVIEAGAVWGGRSVFDFSAQPSQTAGPEIIDGGSGGVSVGWANDEEVIIGEERFREASVGVVEVGETLMEVEGIRSVTFSLGVREIVTEERSVRGSVTFIQPTIEYVSEYLRLVFPFATVMERGSPAPPDSPDLPDLDSEYGG